MAREGEALSRVASQRTASAHALSLAGRVPRGVFRRESGFDAIVGNPPFAGKNTTIAGNRAHYLPWLQTLHEGAHGNADLVAHFFRRAFGLLREGGAFGLIATNTIRQGDTRDTGLAVILTQGGAIIRATRRLKWPGEAAVVVSVVHVAKRAPYPEHVERLAVLDGRSVRRISAYLVAGDLDYAPRGSPPTRARRSRAPSCSASASPSTTRRR